jgi:hypothetical protein
VATPHDLTHAHQRISTTSKKADRLIVRIGHRTWKMAVIANWPRASCKVSSGMSVTRTKGKSRLNVPAGALLVSLGSGVHAAAAGGSDRRSSTRIDFEVGVLHTLSTHGVIGNLQAAARFCSR